MLSSYSNLYYGLLFFTFFSTQKVRVDDTLVPNKKKQFVINGSVEGISSGTVILENYLGIEIDSTQIFENKFSLSGFWNKPELVSLKIKSDYYSFSFFIDTTFIDFQLNFKSKKYSVIAGQDNRIAKIFQLSVNNINDSIYKVVHKMDSMKIEGDITNFIIAERVISKLILQRTSIISTLVKTHRNSFSSLNTIGGYFFNVKDYKTGIQLFGGLSKNIKHSDFGKYVFKRFSVYKSQDLMNKKAFAFSLIDKDSLMVSLPSASDNIVLLDFWASWCVPCIKEIPLLKSLYYNFLEGKIEIISISIDNNKSDWKKALDKYKTPWLSLIKMDKGIEEKYKISSVPRKILIDKKGKIISVNPTFAEILEILEKN